ncbi:MAG: hypothetical protein CL908_20895 [Deltaproteobacteria bacterium]|jgi:hypothetical protein|nr:hypothetical protein [Deltaproteobacteria bacterium]
MLGTMSDANPIEAPTTGGHGLGPASWEHFAQALRRASALVQAGGASPSDRHLAEGYRYLARFLGAGLVSCVLHNDPDYPVFGRMMDYTMPWGLDHPDCLYLYAALRADAEYRVWGARGSANHLDIQVNAGHFALGSVEATRTIASCDDGALELGDGGDFELRIGGPERPGNWLASRDDVSFLLVRQYFYDWENERPADLLIERVGASYPIPPPSPERVAHQLELLTSWIERGGAQWLRMSEGFLSLPENSVIVHAADAAAEHAGAAGQAYAMGHFACEPGEAVIVEFAPPPSKHWVFAMGNLFWEQIEFASRQSSLNGFQARLDPDGHFRGVIAHEDPGVANWLDPAGNTRGTVAMRFLGANEKPVCSFTRVAAKDVRRALPPGTPRVSAQERMEVLTRRRHAVLRRYRR